MKKIMKSKCPKCNYEFEFELTGNNLIPDEVVQKNWMHYILHAENWDQNGAMVGSHDFLDWYKASMPKEAFTVETKMLYPSGWEGRSAPIWRRQCYNGISGFLDKKLGYVEIDDVISDEERSYYNFDIENKISWREHRLTEKFFKECGDKIIGTYNIDSIKNQYVKRRTARYTIEEVFNFLKERNLIPVYIDSEDIDNLTFMDKARLGKIFRDYKKAKKMR